jgi:hypothetical protein
MTKRRENDEIAIRGTLPSLAVVLRLPGVAVPVVRLYANAAAGD